MDPAAQVTQAAKSAFTVRNILLGLFTLFFVFLILDVVGMFFPPAAGFFQAPVSTVRRWVAAKRAGRSQSPGA